MPTEQEVADVLQLVVEHPACDLPVRTLCSLLQVNTAVREALQQAMGHCTLDMPGRDRTMVYDENIARLGACCTWLTQHAGLVTELSWSWGCVHLGLGKVAPDAAGHLIGLALQLLATQAAAAAPLLPPQQCLYLTSRAALPAAAAAHWQLQRVRALWLVTPLMLDSLSTCTSLTSLHLLTIEDSNDPALFAALGRMQQLLDLKVTSAGAAVVEDSFALAVHQLTRLRTLELSAHMTAVVADALPASLQSLTSHVGDYRLHGQPVVMSMAQAVSLQRLKISVYGTLGAASQLPPNVTHLTLDGGGMEAVGGLQELRQLDITDGTAECIPFLQRCSALPRLEALALDAGTCLAMHPPTGEEPPDDAPTELEQLLAGISGAQHLTRLVLSNSRAEGPDEPHPSPKALYGARLHPHLRRLTALCHLDIASLDIEPGDAVHFTCLTALTALHLYNCWSIGEVAVAAVVARVPGLRVLELIDCCLESPVLWPAVGVCTSLESLCIDSAPHNSMVLDGDTLHLLTSLTRLTSLTGPEVKATAAAYEAFCAAMPALVRRPDSVSLQ